MNLYDKAIEYARSTGNSAMIEELSASQAHEIEKKEKGGFFLKHPIIAKYLLFV